MKTTNKDQHLSFQWWTKSQPVTIGKLLNRKEVLILNGSERSATADRKFFSGVIIHTSQTLECWKVWVIGVTKYRIAKLLSAHEGRHDVFPIINPSLVLGQKKVEPNQNWLCWVSVVPLRKFPTNMLDTGSKPLWQTWAASVRLRSIHSKSISKHGRRGAIDVNWWIKTWKYTDASNQKDLIMISDENAKCSAQMLQLKWQILQIDNPGHRNFNCNQQLLYVSKIAATRREAHGQYINFHSVLMIFMNCRHRLAGFLESGDMKSDFGHGSKSELSLGERKWLLKILLAVTHGIVANASPLAHLHLLVS